MFGIVVSLPGSPTEAVTGDPLLTILILVGGVVGGLAIVIGVIFFCKYCVKKSRHRDRTAFFALPVEVDIDRHPRPTLLQFKPRQDETSPLSITHPDDGSPERLLDQSRDDGEPGTDDEDEPDRLPDIPEEEPQGPTDPDDILQYIEEVKKEQSEKQEKQNVEGEGEPSPKKVSFQVCQPHKQAQKRAEYTRRYTEGDFHHLKSTRIKHPSECSKSMSLDYGTAMMDADRSAANVQPMRPLLQPQPANVDTSPSPTDIPSYTAHTIKAQIHIQPNGVVPKLSEGSSMKPVSPAKITAADSNGRRAPPITGHSRSPRRARKDIKDHKKDRDAPIPPSSVASGFVPIPSESETGFAEPISSDGSDGKPNGNLIRPEATQNGPPVSPHGQQKRSKEYHELWHLRTTLEMEDTASSRSSSGPDTVIPANGSKDNIGPAQANQEPEIPRLDVRDTETGTHTWPLEEETEGEKHRLCVIQRHKLHARGDQPDSFEQIFSSISTEESDTSERSKGGDSSGKDSASKLRQMQADSGYTSIEHKNERSEQQKRQLLFTTTSDRDSTSIESMYTPILSSETSPIGDRPTSSETDGTAGESIDTVKDEPRDLFGRKRSDRKTASTKRREFTKGKGEAIFGSFSFPEDDSEQGSVTSEKSVYLASDSQGESPERRRPRMGRLFRLSREERLNMYPKGRDYSIDEKTDALFKEFLRQDAMFETSTRRTRPARGRRLSLHHKQHSDSFVENPSKIMEVPFSEMRSASFDNRAETAKERLTQMAGSSASSSRQRLPQQDSVEEEYLRIESSKIWDGQPPSCARERENNLSVPVDNTLGVRPDSPVKETSKRERGPPIRSHSAAAAPGYGLPSEGPVHLGLEDVSTRRSAFRAVKKHPLLKRSYALEDDNDDNRDNGPDKPEPSKCQEGAITSAGSKSPKSPRSPKTRPRQPSRGMTIDVVSPYDERLPDSHPRGERGHEARGAIAKNPKILKSPRARGLREPPKASLSIEVVSPHGERSEIYIPRSDSREDPRLLLEPPRSESIEMPGVGPGPKSPSRSPWRSPRMPRSPPRTPGTPPRSPHPEVSPRTARRSPLRELRHQSTGSSQGSVELESSFLLAVPAAGTPPDRPHSASSLYRLQQEAKAPPFNRRHSDEAFDDRPPPFDPNGKRYEHSRSPRPHRAHQRLQGRPPNNRSGSENNILDRQNKNGGSDRDLRRQQYGRAHSALDVFAAQKPYKDTRDRDRDFREPKPRRTPERERERDRYVTRSQTFDIPDSPTRERRDRRFYQQSPDRDWQDRRGPPSPEPPRREDRRGPPSPEPLRREDRRGPPSPEPPRRERRHMSGSPVRERGGRHRDYYDNGAR